MPERIEAEHDTGNPGDTSRPTEVKEFLDTRSRDVITTIAGLEPPAEIERVGVTANEDLPLYLGRTEYVRYQRWLRDAVKLSRAGVRPAPSHKTDGGKSHTSLFGAFVDVEELSDELLGAESDENHINLNDESAFMYEPLRVSPLVLLGYSVPDDLELNLPPLPPGPAWVAVSAQTAGLACHHRRFIGIPIQLHAEGRRRAAKLAAFCDSELVGGHNCVGIGGLGEDEIGAYLLQVISLGLTSWRSLHLLEEGCYPLDLDDHNLTALGKVTESDSNALDSLRRLYQPDVDSRWSLFVFGDNCD